MKRKVTAALGILLMSTSLLYGCGSSTESDETAASSESAVQEEAASSVSAEEAAAETQTASSEETESEAEEETGAETASASEDTADGAVLEDGIYTADIDTDSSMFHINEAMEGKGTLTVENGAMTIHMTLGGTGIINLYQGSAEEAQEDGAVLIDPVEETVTYSDGETEEVYGFDVPCPVLDEEFPVAIIGTKGNWYDHTVIVSNPVPAE